MDKYNYIKMSIGKTTIFKLFLVVGIVVISIVFIWYTIDVINQLKADAEQTVTSYVRLWQLAASEQSTGGEVQVIFEEVIKKANFPVIIANSDGEPIFWRNVPGIDDDDRSSEAFRKANELMLEMKEDKGEIFLKFEEQIISYFYYGDSKIIRQLQWMPFIEIGLVAAFILIGFIGFQNIRRSEERHIWVGMAKETAHQLGTPISSLMGWLEVLTGDIASGQDIHRNNLQGSDEIIEQMQTDITRLRRVVNRFSKIGSRPEFIETDIDELMGETVDYFRRRLPFEGKGAKIVYQSDDSPRADINGELFSWAVENLVRNSLQAVDPQSGMVELSAGMSKDKNLVIIAVKDNGKGIPAGIARKIFRPGFTTKKRGWGLGLTLVKRIITEYHRGRIALLKSRPGETVFQIILPVKRGIKVRRFRQYA